MTPDLVRDPSTPDGLDVLVWRFAAPRLVLSSAPLGGGLGLAAWTLNAQVSADYGRHDPEEHLESIARSLGLAGPGVGMMTAVEVRRWQSVTDDGVLVAATVGVTRPTWAAAPDEADAGDARSVDAAVPGTINVVVLLPEALAEGALVNAVTTVAEAKAQALWDGGVPATGTASDAVCVACPATGPVSAFGGPRSHWGSRLARAVHGAVLAGLAVAPA